MLYATRYRASIISQPIIAQLGSTHQTIIAQLGSYTMLDASNDKP